MTCPGVAMSTMVRRSSSSGRPRLCRQQATCEGTCNGLLIPRLAGPCFNGAQGGKASQVMQANALDHWEASFGEGAWTWQLWEAKAQQVVAMVTQLPLLAGSWRP
eukprot:TRINITY_DN24737_c0_g1_i3.p1 TRINITY_DN24737_c0_g1~~TRINITY_DN24737_c0_g1_i3.p1  ORF type:complete len:105 (-),score=11.55 TRINITY_DN24737_c0_g1_i3:1166-1480(-)